jgi:hypothetical protein
MPYRQGHERQVFELRSKALIRSVFPLPVWAFACLMLIAVLGDVGTLRCSHDSRRGSCFYEASRWWGLKVEHTELRDLDCDVDPGMLQYSPNGGLRRATGAEGWPASSICPWVHRADREEVLEEGHGHAFRACLWVVFLSTFSLLLFARFYSLRVRVELDRQLQVLTLRKHGRTRHIPLAEIASVDMQASEKGTIHVLLRCRSRPPIELLATAFDEDVVSRVVDLSRALA